MRSDPRHSRWLAFASKGGFLFSSSFRSAHPIPSALIRERRATRRTFHSCTLIPLHFPSFPNTYGQLLFRPVDAFPHPSILKFCAPLQTRTRPGWTVAAIAH